ncbi:hypothetical protein GH810_06550 [Acetobacterium paludosum]|uniref:YcxB-like protein domain-containing protein n=1 Tax=Acetobacterium paludosum TaxID=52693 RepID=A0A923I0Q4_9FIRM|nr:hypothetical protein [Acetobacterium paludosum]MBC3887968.1 hypothetical protein [Acetobacterium paludosum]
MEPEFIVEIDCTKEELFKACYDYRYESSSYPTASKVFIFCFVIGFFSTLFLLIIPSPIFLNKVNIFIRIMAPAYFLITALYYFNVPRLWQYSTIATQYNINLKKLLMLKKNAAAEDLEQLRAIKKGHITGTLIFYSDHFEYSDLLNNTYLVHFVYEKNDHFIIVAHKYKMVFLIKKSLFLKGTPEEFRTFLDEKHQASRPGQRDNTSQ